MFRPEGFYIPTAAQSQTPEGIESDGANVLAFAARKKGRTGRSGSAAASTSRGRAREDSVELRYAQTVLADDDRRIGGPNVDGTMDPTPYRWVEDAEGAYWRTQSFEVLRGQTTAWLSEYAPEAVRGDKPASCLKILADLMVHQKRFVDRVAERYDSNIVPLRNAYLNLEDDGTIRAHRPNKDLGVDYVVAADLDWTRVDPQTGVYQPRAPQPSGYWGGYIATTFVDQGTHDVAQEALSTVLLTRCYEKGIWLYGEGENGKSVMLHVLKALSARSASVRLSRLTKDQFGMGQLQGARLAVVPEMPSRLEQETQNVLKGLISRDPMPLERKGKDEFTFVPRAVWLFATNHHPHMSDHEHGFWRKILTIPFTNRVAQDQKIFDLHKKITSSPAELMQVVDWLLLGAVRLVERGRFLSNDELPEVMKALAHTQRATTDTVAGWLEEVRVTADEDVLTDKQMIYDDYVEHTLKVGKKPGSAETFWTRMAEHFRSQGLDTKGVQRPGKNGKRVRQVHLRVEGVPPASFGLLKRSGADKPERDSLSDIFRT